VNDAEPDDPGPRTIGDLRRRLAELGDPWRVDPTLSDDEPLPDPPRGGADPPAEIVELLAQSRSGPEADSDIDALIAQQVPANPDLRQRWVEVGMLETTEEQP
jgi:hypothetical protein